MDRNDYRYLQLVTEAHLDESFDRAEQADRDLMADMGIVGVVRGLVVSEDSPSPSLTLIVANGTAYDQQGQRIEILVDTTADLSADSSSVTTDVVGAGNEKWLALYVKFDRQLVDPQVDGNGDTVYWQRNEHYRFIVEQGAEATIGAATRPTLRTDAILIADARREHGVTSIASADIDVERRMFAFHLSSGSELIQVGTPEESDQALLDLIVAHNDAGTHPATAISYAGGPNWANSVTNPAASVEDTIDSIIARLAATTFGQSGMHHIGISTTSAFYDGGNIGGANAFAALDGIIIRLASSTASSSAPRKIGCEARSTWRGGRTNVASSLYTAVDKIIVDLGLTTAGDDGAERVGFAADGNLTSDNVHDALVELDARAPTVSADAYTHATQDDVINAHSGSSGGWTNSSLSKALTLVTGQKVLVMATFGISGTPTGAYSLRLAANGTAIDGTVCGAEIRKAITLTGFFTAPSSATYTFTMQFNNPSTPGASMNVVGAATLAAVPVY